MSTHKRSPNGYSVKLWADGTYHAYYGGECLDECRTKREALDTVWEHLNAREKMVIALARTRQYSDLPAATPDNEPDHGQSQGTAASASDTQLPLISTI